MNNDNTQKEKLIEILSTQLGVEPSEIQENHRFKEDLHLGPAEFTDFLENLKKEGFAVNKIEMQDIETVSDLLEALSSHEEI